MRCTWSVHCNVCGNKRVYAKESKCHFNCAELKYLGFIVGNGCIKPDAKKVQAVADWPRPRSKSDVRSLLGLTNYFRRFIQGYASLVAPLSALLKDDVTDPIQWGSFMLVTDHRPNVSINSQRSIET